MNKLKFMFKRFQLILKYDSDGNLRRLFRNSSSKDEAKEIPPVEKPEKVRKVKADKDQFGSKDQQTFEQRRHFFSTPVSKLELVSFIASFIAVAFLIVILILFLGSKYQRFYFDGGALTIIFFVLVGILILNLVVVAIVNAATSGSIPSYQEFIRNEAKLDEVKIMSRFPELLDFDAKHSDFEKINTTNGLTLSNLCDNFKEYLANELGLYYSIENIRAFIASLGVSKLLILQGLSGTGKTSLALAFGKFIGVESTVVPIQSMWKEKSDLLGYYNEFTGKFNETTILKVLYEANFDNTLHIIVLDEMNIARVEYYFSEFLSLLELPYGQERQLVVSSTGAFGDPKKMKRGKIELPNNVWFIGTANNDDSTFSISDKVYDRAMVLNLDKKAEKEVSGISQSSIKLSMDNFESMISTALVDNPLSPGMYENIKSFDQYMIKTFHITFGNRILRQLRKYVSIYVACGGKESDAVDDLICKKILRKLESKNPVVIKLRSEELIQELDETFGQDSMPKCVEYIHQLTKI